MAELNEHVKRKGRGFVYAPAEAVARPLVSVVTPLVGEPGALAATAAGVLGQSCAAMEWILVRHESEDVHAWKDELAALVAADARVRVVEAAGQSDAALRNAGVAAARAAFVQHLDLGDVPEPTGIEKHLWWLALHPTFGFVKGLSVVDAAHRVDAGGFHQHDRFLRENVVPRGAMVRRAVHAALGGFDPAVPSGLEFWEFFLRAAERGHWGATLPEVTDRRTLLSRRSVTPDATAQRLFMQGLRDASPRVFAGQWPIPAAEPHEAYEPIPETKELSQVLAKGSPRLLLILPWMAMGGADKFNLDLIDQVQSRGWDVTVACTLAHGQPWRDRFLARTPDVFVLPSFLRQSAQPAFLSELVESRRPDVVLISNSEMGYAALPWLRAKHPEIVYTDYVHMEEEDWKRGGHARHSAASADQLDLTMVTSEHLRRWMIQRGAAESRVEVVTINIDAEKYASTPVERARCRAAVGVNPERSMILFPARLTAQKQPLVFARIIRELRARGEGVIGLVAGDGEEELGLRRWIDEHGMKDSIRMLGAIEPERMPDLIRAADIVLLPSRWEGVAVVLYEAMAAGVAFVGADVGGQREIAPEGTAVLLDPSVNADPSKAARVYADRIQELLRDPARREEIGRRAQERVRALYRLESMGETLVAALERASERRARDPRPVLPMGLARELAVRGVETARLEQEQGRLAAEIDAWRNSYAGVARVAVEGSAASAELRELRSSRAYRISQALAKSPLMRALRRTGLI
jgi:glycosyltransferase involved in cell wall biosynthesis